jgi:hypothetical protein
MISLLWLMQAAAPAADPGSLGLSITSLLGSLGAAGAAVAVTYYFLGFLKEQGATQSKLLEEFRDYHAESQRKFQDQLDRLADRQDQSQRGFQDQVVRITEAQNTLLRDAIVAMKSVERSLDDSTSTVKGIEKTISTLQVAVGAIDIVVRRMIEVPALKDRPFLPTPPETT